MAISATLVEQGHHRLRYLITATDTSDLTITIPSTGGATPDLLTDTAGNGGSLRKIAKTFTDGYGKLAAGVQTQAKARALWLSDDPTGLVANIGNNLVPRALCRLTPDTLITAAVDASVDGGGHPQLDIQLSDTGSVYLDVETPGTIGT